MKPISHTNPLPKGRSLDIYQSLHSLSLSVETTVPLSPNFQIPNVTRVVHAIAHMDLFMYTNIRQTHNPPPHDCCDT